VSGLTQLALTVLGGTGLVGLVVGIAFRDITENFLASIFLSIQRPFETADLIEVSGVTGYVRQLNMRTTVVMTLDGNIAQIPNATVYKSTLRNFTTNANRREDFVVGIGYDEPIDRAQEIARGVLEGHPAVLSDPGPLVLADGLGKSTVNLRVYFWINGREHSWLTAPGPGRAVRGPGAGLRHQQAGAAAGRPASTPHRLLRPGREHHCLHRRRHAGLPWTVSFPRTCARGQPGQQEVAGDARRQPREGGAAAHGRRDDALARFSCALPARGGSSRQPLSPAPMSVQQAQPLHVKPSPVRAAGVPAALAGSAKELRGRQMA
jgi:hypothetical protein